MKFTEKLKFAPKQNSQDGVAILLAVMIISAITVITTTVAFFVIQEVRTNRATALTEPAIVAAETAGEQGIYRVKRSNFSASCGTAPYTQLDGSTTTNSSTRIRSCLATGPTVFQFTSAEPLVVYLYDFTNVQGNTCMEDDAVCPADGGGSGNQLYTSLIVKYLTGSFSVNVDIDTVDGVNYANGTLTRGQTGTYPIARNILNSNDERLRITLTATSGSATVEISTTGLYAGLPDYRTLDAEGCVSFGQNVANCDANSEMYTRRLNITLPL